MKRFTCGHTAGANADTSVPCALCASTERLTHRTISHTISASELAVAYHGAAQRLSNEVTILYSKLVAAGFRDGDITITLDTKEG